MRTAILEIFSDGPLFVLLRALGRKFLSIALRLLPKECAEREGALRGLAEQRLYTRYVGYTLILRDEPLPFDRWRQQWSWMQRVAR